jgi:hypothetical protein
MYFAPACKPASARLTVWWCCQMMQWSRAYDITGRGSIGFHPVLCTTCSCKNAWKSIEPDGILPHASTTYPAIN